MDKEIIRLQNINKIYKTGDENTVALQDINLSITNGEFVAIMGPSGSGKSTLMHILGLLDKPSSGMYLLDSQDVSKLSGGKQAQIRSQKIGFVFQQFNLLPRTTVLDNILLPSIYNNSKNAASRAKQLINDFGLKERIKHKPNELSGGQIQRVAVARALINDPQIILADEPTGNLDSKRSAEIMELFQKINAKSATIILITHEESVANYAKRIIKIMDGKIVSDEKVAK